MKRTLPLAARALLLVLCALIQACAAWRPVDPAALARGEDEIRGRFAEVRTAEGTHWIDVHGVRNGEIEGRDRATRQGVAAPLTAVRSLQVYETDQTISANVMFWVIAAPVMSVVAMLLYARY